MSSMLKRILGLDVKMDYSDPIAKFLALEKRADDVAKKELKLRRQVQRTAQKASMLAMATIGFLRAAFTIAGIQLDALQEAVMLSVQQVVNTAVAWFTLQSAIAAGSFGVAAVGMVAAVAALGVAVGNAAYIAIYGEQINDKMNSVIAAIVNLETLGQTFAGWDQ